MTYQYAEHAGARIAYRASGSGPRGAVASE
jgi:hypothetical protein